ncbi:MAG: amino acid adenylation domain-containing protein, partial [Phormidium sp.]
VQPENLAYIIYTSGSTGQPKGVMLCHRNICNHTFWMQAAFPLKEKEKVLQKTPFGFDASVWEFYAPLLVGGQLIMAEPGGHTDPAYLIKIIAEQQVNRVQFVPSLLLMLLEQGGIETCQSLKHIFCGGEVLSVALQEGLLSKLEVKLHNLYGPTEACIDATFWNCQPQKYGQVVPIGRPISNTQIYILDQYLQPVPIGIPGELHIGGAGLAQGYLNRPELTFEKFISNPFSNEPNSRLYKTGDLARYLPDGNIEYLGRIDNQVKIRGFRIELGEIESLLNQYPQIQTAVVVAKEGIPGDKRLVAYITLQTEETFTLAQLRQYLKIKLPEYMVPSAFVVLETFPLTPNGKVDRRALPIPDFHLELQDKYIAPRTPIEEILAYSWEQILNLKRVGIHDNFFALGGNSLLATQLMSRIRSHLQLELPLRSLFEAPTIVELAALIQRLQQNNLQLISPPIIKRENNNNLPLSFAQKRLWFIDQFEPNSTLYNIPIALHLVGTIDVDALEKSFQEIIQRHEALRTNFLNFAGQSTQIIHNETNWKLLVVDLQHLSTTEQEIALQELIQLQTTQSFDLAKESLIRSSLVVLSQTEQVLLICVHHIVSDGWSMGVFVSELTALYNAYLQGQPSNLTPLPIQYADFAIWQREWLQGEVLEHQLSYWQQQLAEAPALLALPTDRSRKATQTFVGANQEFALSVELTEKISQISQSQGVTLFMTLLAAFETLLYRYTGQTDIVVGTPIANRNRSEIEGLIGFFVNTLVLRTDFSEDVSFAEILQRTREVSLAAYTHQDLPFEMLVEALQPERNLSYNPIFQVMFILQNATVSQFELKGLTVSPIEIEDALAKFDLTLLMEKTDRGLVGVWEYNTDLFDGSTIERMTSHFLTLLSAIVANPQQRISQLPLLTEKEQHQLLIEWNNTQVDYPLNKCLHQLFEEQCLKTPEALAVVYESQQLTYSELNNRANQLAHYLRSLGVGANVLVGICVERSLEMVIGLLGILKAGGAYVPLDSEYPTERLQFMLEDSSVATLLTQQQLRDKLPEHQAKLVCLDSDWEQIQQWKSENPIAVGVKPENLAYIIYTSGSTGQPKGAMNTHKGICNRLLWMQQEYQLTTEDVVLQKTPFSFDVSVWEFFWTLLNGSCLVIAKPGGHRDSEYLVKLIAQQQVTTLHFVPSMLQVFLESENLAKCQSLRRVICSGEALSISLKAKFFEKLKCSLHNLYGPTEAAIDVTYWECLPEKQRETVPIGRPLANTQIYILDSHCQPVPVGVAGELHIGGVGLALGYLNRLELTTEKFIPNPFSNEPNSQLYKTGDLARYLPDGNIEYLGRIDNQVKIRGFRIELGEIEALLSQYPQIQATVVIVREEGGDKRLVAYIVPEVGATPITSEVRQYLKARLPEYMIPSAIVILETLPLTHNGKVDRRALPTPDFHGEQRDKYVAPRTTIEEMLAQIWKQLLKVEQVGIYDNFFELGGHSLLATQLVLSIRKNFKVELPLRDLFNAVTLADLAQTIEQLQHQNSKPSIPRILPRNRK